MGVHDGHRQRKKQQYAREGLGHFADHEVLELLLYYAIPRRDTNETAHRLLEHFGSLEQVLRAPAAELQKVEGVGESAALLLTLVPDVMHRARRTTAEEKILNTVDKTGHFFLELLRDQRREVLWQASLDAKGKLLSCRKISSGSVDAAVLSIREVVENALHADASGVVLAHNHPSGIALPSVEDQQVTLQAKQALETMGIRLIDHIIVADDDFVSMAASGLLL